jgi:asparagine synthase (glutamine-hydrolysing)
MCGIAGYFGARPVAAERLDACAALMHHRGPDGSGRYAHERAGRHVQLLHSRLSIIDLDHRADQPFRAGAQVLVFNGEIYDYLERRAELAKAGEVFRTASDTEVLARLIEREGVAALDRCEGMWAFACYDETDGALVLARDRFGEKPLYLLRDADGIYFGSEIKFIRALVGRPLAIDPDHLRRYLVNGYKALYKRPNGFFRDVRELAPATALTIAADGGEQATRFWRPRLAPDPGITFADAVARVRAALHEAVKLRLRADVPMAFCMSGGVDSNALISLAKRVFGYDVHGFTIRNTDARYEEQALVEQSVRELGIRHSFVELSPANFLADLRTLVRAHDAPVITISYFVHWRLMQAIAAERYKISISGTGADELFSGYYDHHLLFLAEMQKSATCRHAAARAAWERHVQPLVRNPFLSDPDRFSRDPGFRDHIYLDADVFAATLVEPWHEPFAEARYCDDNLRNRMLNELMHESVPVILHEDDLNAMYWSIENRSPFLDRGLFETMAAIPTGHLMRDGYAKALLREAVRGIAPDAVVDCRRKVGFNAPLLDLLDTRDPQVRGELLADGPIFEVVRRDAMEHWLDKPSLDDAENKFLFNVLSAKMFLEECAGGAA